MGKGHSRSVQTVGRSEMNNKIFRQKNIGTQWGMIAQTVAQISIFIAIINLLLLAVTAYNTTLRVWFEYYSIPLGFWTFMSVIAVLLLIAAIAAYKFALPSFFSFWNEQFYTHDNQLRKDIENLQLSIDELSKKVNELRTKEDLEEKS